MDPLDYEALLDGYVPETPAGEAPLPPEELVVDGGQVRQAGALLSDTPYITGVRERAERSLYFFAKTVLGRNYLTPPLHGAVCTFLTDFTSGRRKGLLLPRECGKTTLVSHALPLHIQVQPRDSNLYIPGEAGCEQRIVLACETQARGKDHLEVQRRTWGRNELLRAFWPHCTWENPRRDASRWNNIEYDIPREGHWPDPTVRTIGVDGAITGAHPTILIKDDLISVEAANSMAVMASAIEWHTASRALINQPQSLEFIIGTRWAVHDLYSHIQHEDASVEWYTRQLIEEGACIYPPPAGPFSAEKIKELQDTFGTLFLLLYMNSASDPSLTDFDLSHLRTYTIDQGTLLLPDDARDLLLREAADPVAAAIAAAERGRGRADAGKSVSQWLQELAPRDGRRQAHLQPYRRVSFT